jgi:hypothetical protein
VQNLMNPKSLTMFLKKGALSTLLKKATSPIYSTVFFVFVLFFGESKAQEAAGKST